MGDWRKQAACATDPRPEDWFSGDPEEVARAVRVCRSCPVIQACDEAAQGEQHGVWAAQPRGGWSQESLRQQAQGVPGHDEPTAARRAAKRRETERAFRDRQRADPEAYAAYLAAARERMRAARAAESPEQHRLRMAKQRRQDAARSAGQAL